MVLCSEHLLLERNISSHNLGIPGDKFLQNFYSDHPIPHVIVADEAFPLLPTLMRPYPKTHPTTLPKEEAVFNY